MNGFWNDRRVLVTGHTGFKGSWLCAWLSMKGAHIAGLALPPDSGASLFELGSIANYLNRSIYADICDVVQLKALMDSFRPEVVFHLAAQPLVRYSYDNPLDTYRVNVLGTAAVLDVVRSTASCRAVIVITSDKCYENSEWAWGYRETDPLGGYDPYSSSKGCAELVTAAYRRSYFSHSAKSPVGIATARAGNVVGGGDFARDRLIPDLIAAALAGRCLKVRSPEAVRPWQHVLEPLSGYLLLAESLHEEPAEYSESWNFGPPAEDARSVHWILERLRRHLGNNVTWEVDGKSNPHEARLLTLDSAKSRARLGWKPRWDLEQGLRATLEWYKAYLGRENVADLIMQQIASYESCFDSKHSTSDCEIEA